MKRVIKSVLSVIIVFAIMFGAAPLSGFKGVGSSLWNGLCSIASSAKEGVEEIIENITRVNASDNSNGELAAKNGTCGDNLTWKLSEDGTLEISGSGEMDDYDISPGSLFHSPPPWYDERSSIRQVVISSGVTRIGDSAFADCNHLASFVVQTGNAVYSSDSDGVMYNVDKTKLIEYPIGNERKYFSIPDSVTEITGSSFEDSKNLTYVSIPGSVKRIGSCAFKGCTGLTSAIVPESVIETGYALFLNCTNLKSVEVLNHTITNGEFSGCSSLTSFEIPYGAHEIGEAAFSGCTGLENVVFSNSVTKIKNYAFEDCSSLKSITLTDSIKIIGFSAFYGCESLTDVYYSGKRNQWDSIQIDSENDYLVNSNIHFISDENTHTVTYNYSFNGGTSATKTTAMVEEGAVIDLTPTATKSGWSFLGWNTNNNATTKLSSLSMGTSDIVLYAIYKKTLTGTFIDYSGTTKKTTTKTVDIYNNATSGTQSAPTQNTYSGWTSAGWSTGTSANASSTTNFTISSDTTYYGLYKRTLTLSYNANGGSSTPSSQTGTQYSNSYAINSYKNPSFTLANAISKSGSTFSGWAKGSTSGTVYNAGSSISIDANTTMYAKWDVIVHTVTYNYTYNGGSSATKTTATVAEGAGIDLTPTATKSGWTFVGWNTNQNATTKLSSLTMGTSDVTLYAIYKKTLTGTFIDYSGTTKKTTTKTVDIYNNATSGTLSAPTQNTYSGWTSAGWSTGTSANASSTTNFTISSDTTYYGLYKRTLTLSYNANGGSSTPSSQTGTQYTNSYAISSYKNPSFTLANAISKSGSTFSGWAKGSTSGTVYNAGSSISIDANTTMYASWIISDTTNPSATITQKSNNVSDTQTVSFRLSDDKGILGYYWGSSSVYSNNTFIETSDLTGSLTVKSEGTYYLTAKDTSNNVSTAASVTFYKTTLNANGGSVTVTSVLTASGNSFVLPTPTRSGYGFNNWNTTFMGSGTSYTGSYTANSNRTLYAQWNETKNNVKITVQKANGASVGAGAVVELYDSSGKVLAKLTTSNDGSCTFDTKTYGNVKSIVAYKDTNQLGGPNRAAARSAYNNVIYVFREHSMTIDSQGTWNRTPFTGTDMTLKMISPRYLINLSLCYYYDNSSGDYYSDIVKMLDIYADCMNQATDGYVQLNKVAIHRTKDASEFYNSSKIASKSDIRIERIGDESSDRIRSNAHVGGLYSDKFTQKYGYWRIQMSKTTGNNFNISNDEQRIKWAQSLMHETGHYILTLDDEYINGNGKTWMYDLKTRPKGAPDLFGLMERQWDDIEMSRAEHYQYVAQNHYENNAEWLTSQYYNRGSSCWDWFAKVFSDDLALSSGTTISIAQSARRYSNDRPDVVVLDKRSAHYASKSLIAEDLGSPDYGDTPLQNILSIEPQENGIDLRIMSLNGTEPLVFVSKYDDDGYVKKNTSKISGDYVVKNVEINNYGEASVALKNGSTRIVDISKVEGSSIDYVDHSNTIGYKGSSDNEKAWIVVHQGGKIESEGQESYSHVVSISFEQVQSGVLYATVSQNEQINFHSLSWYKLVGNDWVKINSSLSGDEHETTRVSASVTESGTYVVMAEPVDHSISFEPIQGQQFTVSTSSDRDGGIDIDITYSDDDIQGYYVYYSDSGLNIEDKSDSFVYCSGFTKSLSLTMEKADQNYVVCVYVKYMSGQVEKLGSPVYVKTGEYFQEGSQIPYSWIASYSLMENDGQIIDDLDYDGDGFTNLQEYKNGTDPTVSNKENSTVESVSISDMTLGYKSSLTITPIITADEGADYSVEFSSSNPSAISVDNSGRVTSNKTFGFSPASATITVTVTDSNGNTVSDTCTVSVTFSPIQWIIKIVLFGWIWY